MVDDSASAARANVAHGGRLGLIVAPRAAVLAEGVGDAEPTMPNLTEHIREMNRRIELIAEQ